MLHTTATGNKTLRRANAEECIEFFLKIAELSPFVGQRVAPKVPSARRRGGPFVPRRHEGFKFVQDGEAGRTGLELAPATHSTCNAIRKARSSSRSSAGGNSPTKSVSAVFGTLTRASQRTLES